MSEAVGGWKRSVKRVVRRLVGDPPELLEELQDAPALFARYRLMAGWGHRRVPGGWEYAGAFYPDYLTVGGNSIAIRRVALRHCVGRGLDVGAGHWPLPGSLPIDTVDGPGLAHRIEDVPPASQDYVFSSHCLEHIAGWREALDLWVSKLRPGGRLFLYLPHPSCGLWRVDNPAMRGIHAWTPEFDVLSAALTERGLSIVEADEGPDHFFSFYLVGRTATDGGAEAGS
jgi:SAM-dependent methyltransferase